MPLIPTGTVIHPAMDMFADGDDPDTYADLEVMEGLTVTFTPTITTGVVWHGPDGDVSLRPRPVKGHYSAEGKLCLVRRDGSFSGVEGVRLAITDAPQMEPSGWKWHVRWEDDAFPAGKFSLSEGTFNLSTVVLGGALPTPLPSMVDSLLVAYTDLRQLILDNPGGGGSVPWGSIPNQPEVIAAGPTVQHARDSIGAAAAAAIPTRESLAILNVDNTSDADKPVSTATQTALDAKVDSLPGASGAFAGIVTEAELATLPGPPVGTSAFVVVVP